jgi:hypothetical protein
VDRRLPYLLFAAVTLVAFWPVARGHSTWHPPDDPGPWMRNDPPHRGIADAALLQPHNLRVYNEGLKSGELRLWNPSIFCGYPLYSDPVIHPFYPPNLLLHLVLPPRLAFDVGLMLHLFFAGGAMYRLLRALGKDAWPATAGALVWMIGGYGAIWFSTAALLAAGVFAPLALLAVERGIGERRLALSAAAGVALGLLILGTHAQHALHFFIVFAAWLGVRAWREREARGFAAATLVIALGVGAAALLTRLETIDQGYRSGTPALDPLYQERWLLATRWSDVVFGKARPPSPQPDVHSECWVFIGAMATVLAVAGAWHGRREPIARFATILAGLAMLAAFAWPATWLLSKIPVLNLSPPVRWLGVGSFAVAILVAHGAPALTTLPRWPVIAVAVVAAGIALALSRSGAALETVVGLAVAAAALVTRKPALAIAAIAVDLMPAFLHYNLLGPPAPEPELVRRLRARDPGPWRAAGALASPDGKIVRSELVIEQNRLANAGVEMAGGFGAMAPVPYTVFAAVAGGEVRGGGRMILFIDASSPLVAVANVRYVFWPYDVPMPAGWSEADAEGPCRLYANRAAFPRAWVVGGAMPARGPLDAGRVARSSDFHPSRTVILEAAVLRPPSVVEHRIDWIERGADRVRLHVTSEADGFLVLADAFYPGWEATIDGRETPVLRANVAFRAVALTRGGHEVAFRFRPSSARNGLWLTALSLAAALAWLIAARARRPGSRPDAGRDAKPAAAAP